jgi:hypothetical protein
VLGQHNTLAQGLDKHPFLFRSIVVRVARLLLTTAAKRAESARAAGLCGSLFIDHIGE